MSKQLAEWQELYREKNEHLYQFLEPVQPHDFYREIFPVGAFERKGCYEDEKGDAIAVSIPHGGKINGVALEIEGQGKARRYLITDDLDTLEDLQQVPFAIMSPISYFGNRRVGKHARFLYAMVFDLDGVGMPQLRDVLHQMNKEALPKATFIVNSGTGLHLYYVLTEPIPMYPQTKPISKSLNMLLQGRYGTGTHQLSKNRKCKA